MKTNQIALITLIAFIVGFVLGMVVQKKYRPCVELPVVNIERDTVTVRDTIKGHIPAPVQKTIIRVDTLRIQINPKDDKKFQIDTTTRRSVPDTVSGPRIGQGGEVLLPIEQRVYATEDYRAVISGYRPSLDTIDVYAKTTTIRETVTRLAQPPPKRWSLVVGVGAGYGIDKVFRPHVGATFGLNIISR